MPAEPPWSDDLATLDALVAHGLKRRTVRNRIARGLWLEPLPTVVCRTNGELSSSQVLTSATLYAGEGATLSCGTAAAFWGFGHRGWPVHVVVAHGRHLRSTARVVVHQTTRQDHPRLVEEWLVTSPARTAVDLALEATTLDEVSAILGRAVQRARVTAVDLADQLDLAPSRGSRLVRLALPAIAGGAHSASEARLVRLVARSALPTPEYNATVLTRDGPKVVDAVWRSLGKGVEIDGAGFHLDAAAWSADLRRQNAIQTEGIVLLRIAARRLWTEPAAVLAEIAAFLAS
jgi:very-short-patch-repair endonuclease